MTRSIAFVLAFAFAAGLSYISASAAAARRPATSQPVYLYVPVPGGIGRYPIVNGVLASEPVSVLDVTPSGVSGMADGADGSLYVEHSVSLGKRHSQTVVSQYAPGAQGNATPTREFTLTGFTYGTIAVDQKGYVYTETLYGGNCCVEVYAPTAHGRKATPINSFVDFGYFFNVDAAGNVYVSSDNWGVDIWATPSSNPTMVRQICLDYQAAGVAAGESGYTFVGVEPRVRRHTHQPGIVAVRPAENQCPNWDRSFESSPSFFVGSTVEESDGDLFLTSGGTIFEIPETGSDPRTPIAMVSGATGSSSLAIGP